MMRRYLPKDIVGAKKQGFSAPDASWFRGESIDYVKRSLFDDHAPIFDLLNLERLKNLVGFICSEGKKNRRLLIWSLLNINHYLKNTF